MTILNSLYSGNSRGADCASADREAYQWTEWVTSWNQGRISV